MGKNILEIYKEYKIFPGLQDHMLRVAAVASMISDSLNTAVDKEKLITACLLHDMGNIIKADLTYFPDFVKPEGLEYWQKVKDEYVEKYGTSEVAATLHILKELGVSDESADMINSIDFSRISLVLDKSLEAQITVYADNRVDPHGIVSMGERLSEGRNRYKGRKDKMTDEQWDNAEKVFYIIEKNIFSKSSIKPEDINNTTAETIISELKNFVIK